MGFFWWLLRVAWHSLWSLYEESQAITVIMLNPSFTDLYSASVTYSLLQKNKNQTNQPKKKKNRTGVFLLLISTFLIISNNTQHIRIEVTLSWGQCELSNFTYLWPLALKLLQRVALRWHTKAARQAEYISCFLHCLCSSEMPGSALTLAEIRNWELAWAVCLFTWGTAQDWAKSHVWLTQ